MMGRSSRNQGTPTGVVLFLSKGNELITVKKITSVSKSKSTCGGDNLAAYYDAVFKNSIRGWEVVKQLFAN